MRRVQPERFALIIEHLRTIGRETEWVEFKENNSDPGEIGKNISAIANAAALVHEPRGYIVWGVRDADRALVGTKFDPSREKFGNEELENWLLRSLDPHLGIVFETEYVNNFRIVLLSIPAASSNVVRFKGEIFIRSNSYTKPMKDFPEKERRLWESLSTVKFEQGIARVGVTRTEVFDLLDIDAYYNLEGSRRPASDEFVLEQMVTRGIVTKRPDRDFDITNLGAMLFAKSLSDFGLERKAHRTVVYEGDGRTAASGEMEFMNGYASSFQELLATILKLTPQREVIVRGLRRSTSIYPEIPVRELLANSLVHQDFTLGGSGPMVEIFAGRIEITNPGTPLIPADRFLDLPPRSRNEKLTSLMRQLGICEERGTGVDKVITSMEVLRLPPPDFSTAANNTRVTMFAERPFEALSREDRVRGCYQHASIQWASHTYLTNQSLRERFGLPDSKASIVSRIIGDAIAAQRIIPDGGSRRAARYLPFYAKADPPILPGA